MTWQWSGSSIVWVTIWYPGRLLISITSPSERWCPLELFLKLSPLKRGSFNFYPSFWSTDKYIRTRSSWGKISKEKKLKTMGESCKFVIGCVFCSLVSDFWNDRICYRRPCAYIVKIQERKQGIGRRRNSRDACPLQTCACRQAFTLITMGKLM